MSEQEHQEGQKTVVAFVAGLLIGGLLVWVFSGQSADSPKDAMSDGDDTALVDNGSDDTTDTDSATTGTDNSAGQSDTTHTMQTGDGSLSVADQAAGLVVNIASATFPTDEGWVAVRTYSNGKLGSILGAARYSKAQGLVPTEVPLLAPTKAGGEYAVVFFTENGDHKFDLSTDSQIEGGLTAFTAK